MQRLHGVGADSAKLLERIGIRTVEDLLWHLPYRYEDYSTVVPVRSLRPDVEQTTIAMVGHIASVPARRGPARTEVQLQEEDGTPSRHRAVWFGNQFIKQRIQEGQVIRISGKPKWFGQGLSFANPKIEPADREAVHTGRIVPIYRLTEGLKEGVLRRWLHTAVEGARDRSGRPITSRLVDQVPDPLPPEIRGRHELPAASEALQQVHFPDDPLALFRARRRLAFDELLVLQLATAQRRARWIATADAKALTASDADIDAWTTALPFALTGAQQRTFAELRRDLARPVPMTRLLEGDVGSGKTVVAALGMRIAAASGAQSALMAPTELLAEQHFGTLERLFAADGLRLRLLTASVTGPRRAEVLAAVESGEADVLVGTHALLEEGVRFHRLAFAVVDEQHRFGVKQRAALREKGIVPHVLLTTATPIPQTLWQTLNRDLDVSVLDELPAGRQEIRTEVRGTDALPKIWPWVAERVRRGEQAFIVCPRIDPADEDEGPKGGTLFGDSDSVPSAVATMDTLQAGPLKGLRLALVHGRIPQRERDETMRRFRDREIDALVATTVIEVGIDVPNATVMVVLGAERFGLAQLHQLRGRVGRGSARSYCVLVSPSTDSERLAAMTATKVKDGREVPLDGFDLAKKDLQLRGPGQFLGREQSGFVDQLRIVDLMDIDPRLLEDASGEADAIVASDPDLERPEHRGLREAVDALWERYAFA